MIAIERSIIGVEAVRIFLLPCFRSCWIIPLNHTIGSHHWIKLLEHTIEPPHLNKQHLYLRLTTATGSRIAINSGLASCRSAHANRSDLNSQVCSISVCDPLKPIRKSLGSALLTQILRQNVWKKQSCVRFLFRQKSFRLPDLRDAQSTGIQRENLVYMIQTNQGSHFGTDFESEFLSRGCD